MTLFKTLAVEGLGPARLGLGLSYGTDLSDDAAFERVAKSILEKKSSSEAKFLRQIIVWFDITAPRYWWQEASTYRVGVEVQSASTMHTLLRRPVAPEDIEGGTAMPVALFEYLEDLRSRKDWFAMKALLPEGYYQRRVVMSSYQALRGMYRDRQAHRLPEWRTFCHHVRDTVPSAQLLICS